MSYELKMVTCGTQQSIEKNEWCSPIINKILFDPTNIKTYIDSHSKTVFFIVIILDLFGQTIDSLLAEIGNHDNIIGIFICDNQINNLVNNQRNVFHLSKGLPTYTTTLHAMRSYEIASKNLYNSDHHHIAYIVEQKRNELKRWLTVNDQVKVCDILLVPLNTTNSNLYDLQQRIIEFCNGLCHDYEPRVFTLNDYISADESDQNISKDEEDFSNKHNEKIYSLLPKLARIRIYVVGNGDCISNKWSKLMIASESNAQEYDEMCIFMQNEPVTPMDVHNLVHREGSSWRMSKIIPETLDEIEDKSYIYLHALDRGRSNFQAREMTANTELCMWGMGYYDSTSKYSSEFYSTAEPQVDRMIQRTNSTGDMDNQILSNYQIQPPN